MKKEDAEMEENNDQIQSNQIKSSSDDCQQAEMVEM